MFNLMQRKIIEKNILPTKEKFQRLKYLSMDFYLSIKKNWSYKTQKIFETRTSQWSRWAIIVHRRGSQWKRSNNMPTLFSLSIGRFRKSFRFNGRVQNSSRATGREISKNTFVLAWKWTKNTGWHGRDERVTRGRTTDRRIYETRVSRDRDMASLCRMANRREKLNLVVLAARCTLFQLQWNQHLRQIRIPNILSIVWWNRGGRLKSLVLRASTFELATIIVASSFQNERCFVPCSPCFIVGRCSAVED